jgi:transposase-like protein
MLVPQDRKRVGALPKSAHPGAKKHLAEIWNAEDADHARTAVKEFEAAYGVKHPKAVSKIIDDLDELLAFFDFPALRHEAPHYRAEVKDLRHPAVAAA